ncbi:transcription factor DICHOTOMA-like [Diospyros lotus]|uniref:transcription factor DICHOTOMA-like n=1 Tax=Diospyros lotus TaxID=55363 RepID=UPI00225B7CAC|nr:transcription factor DICHOTOMA-like [Diospyros lotus]XP_052180050.1 transcription factor DICHOTOMA-like [Diospyros lotus]XP_052180051.1 transcription factor DICHOTOMA-like [Diospyros lotus]
MFSSNSNGYSLPNSVHEINPNYFSPFFHYEDDVVLQNFHELFLQPALTADCAAAGTAMAEKGECEKQILRKRSSKKDRHSKITTAQGPRDRRMRLSLEVAREFFNLQDMLGFDKASKTVEWLLTKSKGAIEELTGGIKKSFSDGANSASSTSECEVVSGTNTSVATGDVMIQSQIHKAKPPSASSAKEIKKSARSVARKSAFHPLARESREKARARARERTREKNESKFPVEGVNHEVNGRLGSSWSTDPFEYGEESAAQSHNISPFDIEALSSSMIFNNNLQSSGISEEHHFPDFQVYGKPWEAYNSINLS